LRRALQALGHVTDSFNLVTSELTQLCQASQVIS